MRIDPCLACKAVNIRPGDGPPRTHCPACGAPLPVLDPRTGRWAPQRPGVRP